MSFEASAMIMCEQNGHTNVLTVLLLIFQGEKEISIGDESFSGERCILVQEQGCEWGFTTHHTYRDRRIYAKR